jgi:hypothetical protein
MTIGGSSLFDSNKALNTSDPAFSKIRGAGGALFYQCDTDSLKCLFDIESSTYYSNFAQIKGGAIHWDTLEPIFGGLGGSKSGTDTLVSYKNNKAGRYGDNISCFAQQIAIINEGDYKKTLYKATNTLS